MTSTSRRNPPTIRWTVRLLTLSRSLRLPLVAASLSLASVSLLPPAFSADPPAESALEKLKNRSATEKWKQASSVLQQAQARKQREQQIDHISERAHAWQGTNQIIQPAAPRKRASAARKSSPQQLSSEVADFIKSQPQTTLPQPDHYVEEATYETGPSLPTAPPRDLNPPRTTNSTGPMIIPGPIRKHKQPAQPTARYQQPDGESIDSQTAAADEAFSADFTNPGWNSSEETPDQQPQAAPQRPEMSRLARMVKQNRQTGPAEADPSRQAPPAEEPEELESRLARVIRLQRMQAARNQAEDLESPNDPSQESDSVRQVAQESVPTMTLDEPVEESRDRDSAFPDSVVEEDDSELESSEPIIPQPAVRHQQTIRSRHLPVTPISSNNLFPDSVTEADAEESTPSTVNFALDESETAAKQPAAAETQQSPGTDAPATPLQPRPDAMPRTTADQYARVKPIRDINPYYDYAPGGGDPAQWLCPNPQANSSLKCPDVVPMPLSDGSSRIFAPTMFAWDAPNLWYNPLYFEDPALERYGHTHNEFVQPFVSATRFSYQLVGLPYQMFIDPVCKHQYALGYYRPGECAPRLWYLYPPWDWRAAAASGGVYTGLFFIFP